MSSYCGKCSSNLAVTGSNHVNYSECTKCHFKWSLISKPIEKFAFSSCPKCGYQHLECGDHDLRMCKKCLFLWVVGQEELGHYNTVDGEPPSSSGGGAASKVSPYTLVIEAKDPSIRSDAPGGGGGSGGTLDTLEIEPVEVEEAEVEVEIPEEEIIEVEPEEPPVDPIEFWVPEAEVILPAIAAAIAPIAAALGGGSAPIWYSTDVADIFQWAYPATFKYFEEVREAIKQLGGRVESYKQQLESGIETAKSIAHGEMIDAKAAVQQYADSQVSMLNGTLQQMHSDLSAEIQSVAASIPSIPGG